jgi:hypothetical protein
MIDHLRDEGLAVDPVCRVLDRSPSTCFARIRLRTSPPRDLDAVKAGLTLDWSSRSIEADTEPEHGQFRSAVSVREAYRVGESRTDLVFGNHHDMPSVLLHMFGDRQIRAVRFLPVAVVMAGDAEARERIISLCGGYEVSVHVDQPGFGPLNRTAP